MEKRFLRAFLIIVFALPATLVIAPAANADGFVSSADLLDRCDKGEPDSCVFHPGRIETVDDAPRVAGSDTNCTNFTSTRVIRYEAITGTSNSWQADINAGSRLGEIFEAGLHGVGHHEWQWTNSAGDEVRQDIGPHSAVTIWASKQSTRVNGTWEIHFGHRYQGHYIWYVNGSITGQVSGQGWDFRSVPTRARC
ncbi:hypothetical protein [Rathayibacter rathayi]|uniref:hypothetical protein n=1 Tax=Rathayibacter rathayi TaxID=33887 RepID=UPI0011B0CD8C|nr:hypothetical protein [Rathayibacter rathayi]